MAQAHLSFRRLITADLAMITLALVGMVIIYRIYAIGFSFGFSFDDEPNLKGLSRVINFDSAMLFVFGGTAGPLGRPLSMASFLVDIAHWPDHPAGFIRTNALLHQINILLVMWVGLLIGQLAVPDERKRRIFAVLVALMWGMSPLILSSTLMAVQRMNLLSATCVLVGLVGFLKVFACHEVPGWRGLALAAASLIAGSSIGILAKENAILLPVYALCVAAFLPTFRKLSAAPIFPVWWRMIFLYLPLAYVIFYLLRYWWLTDGVYPGRNFDVVQRLISESRVLFRYLHMLLLPTRTGIGPYQDGYTVSADLFDPPTGIISVMAWIVLAAAAVCDRADRFGWFRFAVLWYLLGHILESTVVGLELYFEHRNYLPSLGVWFALVGWSLCGKTAPAIRAALLTVVAAAHMFVLVESVRVWSSRELASAVWVRDNPASQRALMFRTSTLAENRDIEGMIALVRDADTNLQEQPDFISHKLDVYCSLMPTQDVRPVVLQLQRAWNERPASHHSGLILTSVAARIDSGHCNGISQDEVRRLFEVATQPDPRFSPALRAFAHQYLRDFWVGKRDLQQAMYHARKRFEIVPDIAGAELMVEMLLSADLHNEAAELLPWFRRYAPRRPYVRGWWMGEIDRIEARIENARLDSTFAGVGIRGVH